MGDGSDATCKRLRKFKDGIELVPNNPAYDTMFYGNDDILKLSVKIIGRVESYVLIKILIPLGFRK